MIGAAVILTAALLLFSAGIETGWILPANYAEGMLTGRARQIQSAERVTEDLIPETCRYGVYDREGTYLYGTFEKEEREDAWEIYREGERGKEGYYFRSFDREREVCIVKYRMVSSYTNKFLRQYFPAADWTLIGVTVILFFLYLIWLAKRFGRIISREISSLEQVTENISQQELNFERKSSKVLEIDAVLQSMDQMREALKQSLHRQWNMEQVRREQMAALAHEAEHRSSFSFTGGMLMKIKKRNLLLLAAIVWMIAGFNILRIGIETYAAYKSVINFILSLLIFLFFWFMIFYKLTVKHTDRIQNYQEERQFFLNFFDLKSFLIMAFMITFGITIRTFHLLPDRFIAVFYTGLGAALFLAGITFGRNYIFFKKTETAN